MGVSFHMEDHSEEFEQQLHDRMLVALDAAGMQASSLAKRELQKSPMRVDTGLLRNSITHAVAGKPAAIGGYHADKGSNRYTSGKNKGKRKSAKSKNAGAVGVGFYRGTAPDAESPDKPFVLVGTNVEYALYVHEGTRYMSPNRFLKNALESNQAELRKIVEKVLKQ